jgi:hypothetical protein
MEGHEDGAAMSMTEQVEDLWAEDDDFVLCEIPGQELLFDIVSYKWRRPDCTLGFEPDHECADDPCLLVCADCRTEGWDLYMVRNEVWAEAGMDPLGILCIPCLEARLGRRLHRSDFTYVPINSLELPHSPLFIEILSGWVRR